MAKSHLKLVPPATVNRTVQPVPPGRRSNAELRSHEHLTEAEIERLIDAAKSNRHGHRDAAMLLAAFRHGLRTSERPPCTSAWPRKAHPARTQSLATNCARAVGFSASRSRSHRSSSRPKG